MSEGHVNKIFDNRFSRSGGDVLKEILVLCNIFMIHFFARTMQKKKKNSIQSKPSSATDRQHDGLCLGYKTG